MSRNVFLAPHSDDETLFGAFTLLRDDPLVVIVFGGGYDREKETNRAMEILECDVIHWNLDSRNHLAHAMQGLLDGVNADRVYAPAWESNGHRDHNLLAQWAANSFDSANITSYLTYTQVGPELKRSTGDLAHRVVIEDSRWVLKKIQALACYTSQICSPPGYPSYIPFLEPQWEWYA